MTQDERKEEGIRRDFHVDEEYSSLEEELSKLLTAAEEEDGVAPISDAFMRGMFSDDDDSAYKVTVFLDCPHEVILGVAVACGTEAEMVIHPNYRHEGHGSGLADVLVNQEGVTQVWAHGDLPDAQKLARAKGWTAGRTLYVLALRDEDRGAFLTDEGKKLHIPSGFSLVTFGDAVEKYGRDAVLQAWLVANNEAFDWHPEQGHWDREKLEKATAVSWFDPSGVFLLMPEDEEPTVAGFHWTKVHADGRGEVYVIGLADGFRGRGLSRVLLQAGIRDLLEKRQCRQVILYVESDNEAAVALYLKMGFSVVEQHVRYSTGEAVE